MKALILQTQRNMLTLVSTRLLFFVGDPPPLKKLSWISNAARLHTSLQCQSRVDRESGPLTLASLGFRGELEPVKRDKPNELGNPSSVIEVPKTKAKPVRSIGVKAVKVKAPLEIDSALFAAKTFSELNLPPLLIERLERVGLTVPTDVQSTAIPTILQNHDVVIQSYTGSGKTLAYLLPILSEVGPLKKKLSSEEETDKRIGIEAVIVAPSRELGMQIVREFEKILGPEDKKLVQQLVGGANKSRQEEALRKNKPAIVVGTPGRIAEISATGKLHTHNCRFLVLDEVDELLSFNFREDMHRILEHVGRRSGVEPSSSAKGPLARRVERQTILVSATVPFSVTRAARSWGRNPVLVRAKTVVPLESVPATGPDTLSVHTSSSTSNTITQGAVESLPPNLKHFYCVTRLQHKIDSLRRCVHALDAKSVIAFMNHTKRLKDAVFKLEARGIKAAELHGDLGKLARSTTLKKFKNGELRILVTNELSARGLDVSECDLVVNLDLPTDSIHYAHRAGRAGRLGRKGSVVTICEDSEVFVVKKLRRQLGIPIQACEFTEGKLIVSEEEETEKEKTLQRQ
ncbi:Helicase [Macleaya cordata]|uniref:RNA helicase n=1 Tax=Macleaya cordata TaxID=56857 RepID=A0A200QFI9_MACCD|nr:Helicase [Macleaya cordata]